MYSYSPSLFLGHPVSSLRAFPLDWPKSFTPVINFDSSQSEQSPLIRTSSISSATQPKPPPKQPPPRRFGSAIGVNNSRTDIADLEAGSIQIRRKPDIKPQAIEILFYSVIVAQVFIGLFLVALGASRTSFYPDTITVLGTVSVFMAVVLALLRTMDLPEEPKKEYQCLPRSVSASVEEMEARLAGMAPAP